MKARTKKYGLLIKPVRESKKAVEATMDVEDLAISQRESEEQRKAQLRMLSLRKANIIPRREAGEKLGLDLADGRLQLFGARQRQPARRPQRCFRRVMVFGAHHTCTTAMVKELQAQFDVDVINHFEGVDPEFRPENHKHRIMQTPPQPDDALLICMTKDPFFWLQSLTRHSAIYSLRPVVFEATTHEWKDVLPNFSVMGIP